MRLQIKHIEKLEIIKGASIEYLHSVTGLKRIVGRGCLSYTPSLHSALSSHEKVTRPRHDADAQEMERN